MQELSEKLRRGLEITERRFREKSAHNAKLLSQGMRGMEK